jgi:hypothetical protein
MTGGLFAPMMKIERSFPSTEPRAEESGQRQIP